MNTLVKNYKPNSLWLHFKGGLYVIENIVVNTKTNELDILYKKATINEKEVQIYKKADDRWFAMTAPMYYTRPISEWEELVLNAAGKHVPRFTLVEK